MQEVEFVDVVKNMKNFEKVEIKKNKRFGDFDMSLDHNFTGDIVKGQFLSLINPNIHLSTVIDKLYKLNEPISDPVTLETHDPKVIADDLVRYCQLNREDPIYGIKNPQDGLIWGAVSPRHIVTFDYDVYQIWDAFMRDIPHEAEFYHNGYRAVIETRFPELAIELGNDNSMQFKITVGNSQLGVGSCFARGGSWEEVCSNGVMGWKETFKWSKNHIIASETILKGLQESFVKLLSNATNYTAILRQANEIITPIIKENESVVRVLRGDKFKLLKREAESVYRRIRSNPLYQRMNGFDMGRAIAEEARDTINLNRHLELESLAGFIMTSQVRT